ncbi:MAG: hypothetical protein JNM25_10240 [Planctomycetes bacterium]|nr:hypothetical protein [Planctomycetota bacterium]
MQRSLAFVTSFLLFVAAAAAQCLSVASPGSTLGSGDETLFGPVAMGISFPMAGAGGPFTHCVVNTNGVLYLTTGGAAVDANLFQWGDTPSILSGAAGASPRIAPFLADLVTTGPAGFVAIDTTVPGRCAVTWVQAKEFLGAATKNVRAELFSSGEIRFSYAAGLTCESLPALVGVSIGNATALPAASDLSAAPLTATGITWQQFDPALVPFDLGGTTIAFTPSGAGYQVATVCEAASHQAYGAGCYAIARESFYQSFPTAAAAAAALNGQSMRLQPTANGYSVTWGGGSYVAPTIAAVALPLGDDDQTVITPTIPFPVGGGAATQLFVHANGFVSTASGNDDGPWNPPSLTDYTPSAQFRNAPATAFWSWHDYDPTSGIGRVKREQAVVGPDTILYVTWDAVESYAVPETANPSTFQFQFNLTTGSVTYVWQNLTAIGTGQSPTFPESHLIGFSPGGASFDPGSITLATALPLTTTPDLLPLVLSASPAPIISGGGTGPAALCTYTVGNVPEFDPTGLPGIGACTLVWSVAGAIPGGVDLGTFPTDIGMPGCPLHVLSADAFVDISGPIVGGAGGTRSFSIAMPQPLTPGLEFFVQALSLLPAGTPAGGSNNLVGTPYGARTSNGLEIHYQLF